MLINKKNPWKTESTTIVYSNPWITVREDNVIQPSGNNGIYGVVQTRIATGVVALTDKGEVILVGQYRYATECYSWEIVEGGAERDENPIEAAKRELAEEAGFVAENWEQLGAEIHLSNSHSDERAFLYVAKGLTVVPRQPDETEELEVVQLPFETALEMVDRGDIKDALSIIGLLRIARGI
jgi:8-oxo-dGTP pyrophosphatase MutT (NUDIX family)